MLFHESILNKMKENQDADKASKTRLLIIFVGRII